MDPNANLDIVIAYGVSIAAFTAVLVQLIKQIFIDPRFPSSAQRDGVLRGLTYVLNFVALCLVLWSKGLFEVALIYEYLLIAFGQSVVSHVGYKVLSSGSPSGTEEGGAGDTSGQN